MRRSTIVVWCIGLVVLMSALFTGQYYLSLKKLTINFDNVSTVQLYDTSKTKASLATLTNPGQTVRVRSGTYLITYKGAGDYADGSQTVFVNKKQQTVKLQPFYSSAKLGSLLAGEQTAINQALSQQIPGLAGNYQINTGTLFQFGDWYGTTLTYKGQDIFNADTLRVVLHKEGSEWKVASGTPSISISRPLYPTIPREVVVTTNRL